MIAPETTLDSAPLLRGEFELATAHGAVVSADLVLTAQGAIETWLNGQPVSDELLTPGWSSFEWRLRYVVYDVRELLAQTNVLGITLGKGWYGGRLGWAPGKSWYGDQLGALAQLEVVFEDGHRQVFGTDETWAAGPSAILANDLYDGETIDARRRNDSWMLPNCSPAGWGPTQVLPFETSKLQRHAAPRLKRLMQLPVREITTSPSGRTWSISGKTSSGGSSCASAAPEAPK
jgi:alpha-L-rhamnosidase